MKTIALAGGVAGVVADTMFHPIDTVSHRAKVHPQSRYGTATGAFGLIVKEEGIRGLLAGVSVPMLTSGPATAGYFFTYHSLKDYGLRYAKTEQQRQGLYLACGAAAELACSAFVVPTEVVKCRLQLGANPHRATGGAVSRTMNYGGPFSAVSHIVRTEGLGALWSGWKSAVIQDCAFSALTFLVYENARIAITSFTGRDPTGAESFAAGGLAGGVAAALTNPLDTVTSRLMIQDSRAGQGGFGSGMTGVIRQALAEGPGSLWRGTAMRVLHAVPSAAMQFAIFETVRSWIEGPRRGGGGSSESSSPRTLSATGIPGRSGARTGHTIEWMPVGVDWEGARR